MRIRLPKSTIKKYLNDLRSNLLLFNSLNLMIATAVTALFGFIFWIIVAHSFQSSTIGLATTLLSMSSLIALLSLAGFDTVFIRYISRSNRKNDQINTGLIASAIVSIVFSTTFCLLIPFIAPSLSFVNHNLLYILIFVVSTIFATWNTLTNSVFIAYRKTSFVLVINMIFSAARVALPFVIHTGGAMTIFLFVGITQLLNVALSIIALIKYFEYKPSLKIHFDILREIRDYGLVVYLSNIFNLLPDSALPIIILNKLGPVAAAYFYITFTIANLLYTIAFSTTQALFAEAANDEKNLFIHVRKGLRVVTSLMVPAVFIIVLLSPLILSLFGDSYAQNATGLLRILAISGIAVAIYSAMGVIFKITGHLKAMLSMTFVNAAVIILLSLLLINNFGLEGAGWAWLIGSFTSVAVGLLFLKRQLFKGIASIH